MADAKKTSDITDLEVVAVYAIREIDMDYTYPYQRLMVERNCAQKIAISACERAHERGLINYGVSLQTGRLSEKGKQLLHG